VADFLGKILSSLYKRNEEGFFPLGMTDRGRWLEQLLRRSYRLDLVFDSIPLAQNGQRSAKEWYSIIHDLIGKGTSVRLFFKQVFQDLQGMGPDGKVTLHSLAAFSQSPNIAIFTLSETGGVETGAYIELEEGAYVIRWPQDKNPFDGISDIEVSVLGTFTSTVKEVFERLANDNSTRRWYLEDFNKLLQGTRVLTIKGGTDHSWKDILLPVLPDSIQEVEIYDRFIRNIYQFKSLEMLLDAFEERACSEGVGVQITTTAMEDLENIRGDFNRIVEDFGKKGFKIQYQILEPSKTLPHFRRIIIKAKKENLGIWLDRGIDIFRFESLRPPKYVTLDSYVVMEAQD